MVWNIFFLSIIKASKSLEGYLYSKSKSRFVYFEEFSYKDKTRAYLIDSPKTYFSTKKENNNYIIKERNSDDNEVVSIGDSVYENMMLKTDYKQNKAGQLFTFDRKDDEDDTFKIKNNNKCLESGPVEPFFAECTESIHQIWAFFSEPEVKEITEILKKGIEMKKI